MNTYFIFDIDGVITEPMSKIPNPYIISFIAKQLNNKQYIALETGRSLMWIGERILKLIQSQLEDINNLDYLFISCEKGSVTATFTNGLIKTNIDNSVSISQDIQEKIKQELKGEKEIFFDPDKQTMVSVEIIGGTDQKQLEEQKNALSQFEIWVNENILPTNPQLKIDKTPISVDIQYKDISKKTASKKFLEFLQNKNISSASFIAFGDTLADIDIAEVIYNNKFPITFIYVGEVPLEKQYPFQTISIKTNKYDKAVEEYLKTL